MIERKERRIRTIRPVFVDGIEPGTYSALTVDFSKSGLCVVTNLSVEPGQEIELFSDHLWHEPQLAKVLWKTPVVADSSKVGMSLKPANR